MISHSKPWLTEADQEAVAQQLHTGNIAAGNKVAEFNKMLREYLNVEHFFLTANGSNAIYIALLALGIGKGDEVILPTYVCRNVQDAVRHCGAEPVLCDIAANWSMAPANVAECITGKTKAIIVVHTLGIVSDVAAFRQFNIAIIEDCCQCFADKVGDLRPGMYGDISVYSFNATKCLTTGEGGGISTTREDLAQVLQEILKNKSIHNPLTDLQAALGISQLSRYNEAFPKRKSIADLYFSSLNEDILKDFSAVRQRSMFFRFLLSDNEVNFEDFRKKMHDKGIAIRKGVDSLLSDSNKLGEYPNAEETYRKTISIPIYPSLEMSEVKYIAENINEYYSNRS